MKIASKFMMFTYTSSKIVSKVSFYQDLDFDLGNLQMFEDELDQLGPHNEEMLVSRLHQAVDLIEVLRGSVLPYIGGFNKYFTKNC